MTAADTLLAHLAGLEARNATALDRVASLVHDRLARDGLLFVGGAGHSLAGVAEVFYRAGGLAAVRPLYHSRLWPLNHALDSTAAEREPGLGNAVVAAAAPGGDDLLVVFSNSGVNPYPVELAQGFGARGLPVVAVTSLRGGAGSPARAGARLAELADVVLDTDTPPGDVAHPGPAPRTAPLSTVGSTFLWSLVLARLHDLAAARGTELPVWRSANVADGDAANATLLARYGPRIPELGL